MAPVVFSSSHKLRLLVTIDGVMCSVILSLDGIIYEVLSRSFQSVLQKCNFPFFFAISSSNAVDVNTRTINSILQLTDASWNKADFDENNLEREIPRPRKPSPSHSYDKTTLVTECCPHCSWNGLRRRNRRPSGERRLKRMRRVIECKCQFTVTANVNWKKSLQAYTIHATFQYGSLQIGQRDGF